MKIEDYWDDTTIYYVEFLVLIDSLEKKICKTLIFPEILSEDEISNIIRKKFNSVLKIIHLEEVESCLSYKLSWVR